jgi:hypothetical protein
MVDKVLYIESNNVPNELHYAVYNPLLITLYLLLVGQL